MLDSQDRTSPSLYRLSHDTVSFLTKRANCRDTARRHSRTCPKKAGRSLPSPRRRGRRFKACDSCALAKSGCDAGPGQPCSKCSYSGQSCTYYRVVCENGEPLRRDKNSTTIHAVSWVPREFLRPLSDLSPSPSPPFASSGTSHDSARDTGMRNSKRIPISFLLGYTNPLNESIREYFDLQPSGNNPADCERYGQDSSDPLGDIYNLDLYRDPHEWIWDRAMQDSLPTSFSSIDFLSAGYWEHIPWSGDTQQVQAASDTYLVEIAMEDVVMTLKSHHIGDSLAVTPESLLDSARLIFAAGRVDIFVQSYFDTWHRHCPILHRPSFHPSTTFTPLLAAVVLIGATYSSRKYAKAARNCLDAMEAYVFNHEAFRQLVNPASSKSATLGIAPLQAAFLVTVLQHWDHHHDSRRRMRLQRFADLVSAARHLGLPTLRHFPSRAAGMAASSYSWKAYVRVEEAIR